jgi:hypothetical protein
MGNEYCGQDARSRQKNGVDSMMKQKSKLLMVFVIVIPLIFLGFVISILTIADGSRKNPGLKIESLEPVEINGVEQWLLIRGHDVSKPVILFLHGGPGHSSIPFAHAATGKLVDKFIVVFFSSCFRPMESGSALMKMSGCG